MRQDLPMGRSKALLAAWLLGMVGCSVPDAGDGPAGDGTDRGPDGGMVASTPVTDGFEPDPDAQGSDGDAARDGSTELPLAAPHFELTCAAQQSTAAGDPREQWEQERLEHGPIGHAASFQLQGSTYRVTGETSSTLSPPFTLRAEGDGSGLIAFDDAVVEGSEQQGRLEVYAGDLNGDDRGVMPVLAGTMDGLALRELSAEQGALLGTLALVPEQVGSTDRYHAQTSVQDLQVDNVQVARLYPEGSSGTDERIELMPEGPLTIDGASRMTFYDAAGATVLPDSGQALELRYEAFDMAGDFTGGSLEVPGMGASITPIAVFGRGATLRATAEGVESADFRVTQALDEGGLLLPAEVEVVASQTEVWVAPGEERVIELYYP